MEYIVDIPDMDLTDRKRLIRCKNCKHKEKDGISEGFHYCNVNGLQVTDDWFCADGKEKDGEQE